MTFSRMAALASSSLGEGGGRGAGLGLRKAFQAKWRVKPRKRGEVMREMDITLRMDVCIHNRHGGRRKKGRKVI